MKNRQYGLKTELDNDQEVEAIERAKETRRRINECKLRKQAMEEAEINQRYI